MGTETFLRDINSKTKDPVLSKFLNYAINSLSQSVKSREELLEDILSKPLDVKSLALDQFDQFNPFSPSPSPSHFHNLFKTPMSTRR
jgi:hypothetical protein